MGGGGGKESNLRWNSISSRHPRRSRGWVDFKSGQKSPWGHSLTWLVPNGCSCSGIWLVPENLCVFLPNQSEVCFRGISCVLTRRCTRSSVANLVCLGRATKLCSRWKVSVSAHNVREIDQIVRENLTRNYTEYFRRYHKRTYLKFARFV